MSVTYKSKLEQVAHTFPTDYWNDSCSMQELAYAVEHGAVGATSNPTIVHNVLKKEMPLWRERILQLIEEHATWDEVEITWALIEEMAAKAAGILQPAYDHYQGQKGRLSIQTNPAFYRNTEAITSQALRFHGLAPNMQVKAPVTSAGLAAIEEATFQGVSMNATVSFTVPQAVAVAEAVEGGLNRRSAAGLRIDDMSPVCTIMVGRTDDWLKALAKRDGIAIDPAVMDWAGIACMKRAYAVYQDRGYRSRLLVAAYRHLGHIAEFVGGDLILSIPYEWQLKYNDSDLAVSERMSAPVDAAIIDEMLQKLPDFRRAYEPEGMSVAEFDTYGATVRTLRGFIGSAHDLIGEVRDLMLPNPDLAR